MKLFFLLVLIGVISFTVYLFTAKQFKFSKKRTKANCKPLAITAGVVVVLLGFLAVGLYTSATQPDMQCTSTHSTTMKPPSELKTATDYFTQGDYDYDLGNCQQAVVDYTMAIRLNPRYPEAYNNRAYTNMRMRKYSTALPDLDKALELKPDYVQALMNRGDIHNYYYQIDRPRAIKDYEKVIALGGKQQETSVCGHLFLAKHNGWTLGAYLGYFIGEWATCK